MHFSQRELFKKHLAQTSPSPLGLEITHAKGEWLFASDGRKYLDLISGISVSAVGHCHPKIVSAVEEQAKTHMHLMVYGEYIQAPQVKLAKKLAEMLPENLSVSYLVNSGAEATEGALKLAKRFTGKTKIVSFSNAYHGSTHGALSVMGNETLKNAFRPLLPDVLILPFNEIPELEKIDQSVAAVIIEPIQGESGVRACSTEFLSALRKRCNEMNALLIFDEIQSGVGRSGSFCVFETFKIIPDILLLAKGLGGGMPIGAFISSPQIMQTLSHDPVLGHITTFGGHPVSAAAALACLEEISQNQLWNNAHKIEAIVRSEFKHPTIVEIRGKGAMLAVEFGSEEINMKLISKALEKGIITDWFLFCPTAMRIAPPLNIDLNVLKVACREINSLLQEF